MTPGSLPAFLEESVHDHDPGIDINALEDLWDLQGQMGYLEVVQVRQPSYPHAVQRDRTRSEGNVRDLVRIQNRRLHTDDHATSDLCAALLHTSHNAARNGCAGCARGRAAVGRTCEYNGTHHSLAGAADAAAAAPVPAAAARIGDKPSAESSAASAAASTAAGTADTTAAGAVVAGAAAAAANSRQFCGIECHKEKHIAPRPACECHSATQM